MPLDPSLTVEQFARGWLAAKSPFRPPFELPVTTTDIAYSLCLFRSGQFQVELYICKPNTQAPFHSHPGVDSYFVFLAGNITPGMADGSFKDTSAYQEAKPDGTHKLLGHVVTADNSALHTLKIGAEGGAFLSFEKWHDKPPTSVTLNWAGDSVGPQHSTNLELLNHLTGGKP